MFENAKNRADNDRKTKQGCAIVILPEEKQVAGITSVNMADQMV